MNKEEMKRSENVLKTVLKNYGAVEHKGNWDCPGTHKDGKSDLSIKNVNGEWVCSCHCGLSGDVFKVVEILGGLSNFKDQMKEVQRICNISDDTDFKSEIVENKEVPKMQFDFTETLEHLRKEGTTEYFKSRGLSDTIIDKYGLFTLNGGIAYISRYVKHKYNIDLDMDNNFWKAYNAIIPIKNDNKVVNLIGRVLEDKDIPVIKGKPAKKAMNLKNFDAAILNIDYLHDETIENVFICEGWADALSLETLGYKAIALNSTSNVKKFNKELQKNKDLAANKTFIICGDCDNAGNKMNKELKNVCESYKLNYHTLIIPESQLKVNNKCDINDWFLNDRNGLKSSIEELLKQPIVSQPLEVSDKKSIFSNGMMQDENGIYKLKEIGNGENVRYIKNYIADFNIKSIELIENKTNGDDLAKITFIANNNSIISRSGNMAIFDDTKAFKAFLNSTWLGFKGNNNDLIDLKSYAFSEFVVDYKKSYSVSGVNKIDGEFIYLQNNGYINKNGEFNTNIICEKEHSSNRYDNVEEIRSNELSDINDIIFNCNDIKVTTNMIGWVCSTFLNTHLMEIGYFIPLLKVCGEAGSGKNTLCDLLIRNMLGINEYVDALTVTNFTLRENSSRSNTLPILIDEYKPSKFKQNQIDLLSGFIRNTYNHSKVEKGNVKYDLKTWKYLSPVLLIGEEGFADNETALYERSNVVFMSKSSQNTERNEMINYLKNNKKLMLKLGKSIMIKSLNLTLEQVKEIIEKLQATNNIKLLESRIQNTAIITSLGLYLYGSVCEEKGIKFKLNIKHVCDNLKENVLEGKENVLSLLDRTIMHLDTYLNSLDNFAPKNFYKKDLKNKTIALNLKAIYPEFTKYMITHYKNEGFLQQNDFTKQLQKKDFFIKYSSVRLEKLTKCYFIDYSKMTYLDLEFMTDETIQSLKEGELIANE